ncbi:hypothetical protein HOY80DRAFT_946586 [Tuber brumale]|nr:hypothetical protein HOY80DRAFT_946586 [Tuber brumale]
MSSHFKNNSNHMLRRNCWKISPVTSQIYFSTPIGCFLNTFIFPLYFPLFDGRFHFSQVYMVQFLSFFIYLLICTPGYVYI